MDKTPRTLLKGVARSNSARAKDEPKDAIKGFITKSTSPKTSSASLHSATPIKAGTPLGRDTPVSAKQSADMKKMSNTYESNEKPSVSILDSFLIWLNVFLFVGIILTLAALALFVLTLNKVEE